MYNIIGEVLSLSKQVFFLESKEDHLAGFDPIWNFSLMRFSPLNYIRLGTSSDAAKYLGNSNFRQLTDVEIFVAYYSSIILNSFGYLLFSKLCYHIYQGLFKNLHDISLLSGFANTN